MLNRVGAGLVWTQNIATGVDWQDAEHRILFERINRLIDAMQAGKGREELSGLFKFLDDYVKTHFRNEESAMDKYDYPEARYHRMEHNKFIDNILYLKYEFNREAYGGSVAEARKLLADWFYDHIARIDKKLGAFLLDKMKAGPAKTD